MRMRDCDEQPLGIRARHPALAGVHHLPQAGLAVLHVSGEAGRAVTQALHLQRLQHERGVRVDHVQVQVVGAREVRTDLALHARGAGKVGVVCHRYPRDIPPVLPAGVLDGNAATERLGDRYQACVVGPRGVRPHGRLVWPATDHPLARCNIYGLAQLQALGELRCRVCCDRVGGRCCGRLGRSGHPCRAYTPYPPPALCPGDDGARGPPPCLPQRRPQAHHVRCQARGGIVDLFIRQALHQ